MKEIITKKTIEETSYEALDGSKFKNRELCEEYEESLEGVIKARFKAIGCEIGCEEGKWIADRFIDEGNGECDYYRVTPKKDADINTIMQFMELDVDDGSCFDTTKEKNGMMLAVDEMKVGETYIICKGCFSSSIHSFEKLKAYQLRGLDMLEEVFKGEFKYEN